MTDRHAQRKTTPRFFVMLTIVCIVAACAVYFSQEQKFQEIRTQTAALEEEYQALANEKQRVEYMIEYAQSEAYRIQYAREKLGYVHPGDIKFKIQD